MSRIIILAIFLMFLVAIGASADTFEPTWVTGPTRAYLDAVGYPTVTGPTRAYLDAVGYPTVIGPTRAYLDAVGYPEVIGPTRGGWGVFGPG